MTIRIHNTATRQKEEFTPIDPAGKGVGMYVCGPTVYDRIHIGNARPLVVFDVFARLLRHEFDGKVTYVRNITDVDDKINNRAAERGITIRELTDATIETFHQDAAALGCVAPDVEPRATDHIAEMIDIIEKLVANGHAYEKDGHVLFDVPSWPDYGKFSGRDRDEQVAGARVEVAPYKKDPADFVLWKPSSGDEPGWESPWGYGRPGWHIECSAMSSKYLGETFDIHGGGQDLIFPHHQNEVAQSCCGHKGSDYARYWMHNGYLLSEGEKMSKSLGNFYTVAELLEEFPGEALRLVLLQTHYRQPLDFSKEKCREAKATLDRLYGTLRKAEPLMEELPGVDPSDETIRSFYGALEDDLNTAEALAVVFGIARQLNMSLMKVENAPKQGTQVSARIAAIGDLDRLLHCTEALGLLAVDPDQWLKGEGSASAAGGPSAEEIEALIAERIAAKTEKNFARADEIRDGLKAQGVVLEDKPGGATEWRRG
ncbi:cysteine--tRNA ligase [Hwanghaeella grinnelliae]|uniref:Cysteine--tRNA ligase n=1 Tax=Hwanghaeella grinnelliae TaxID=2500179 RepID=A0A3S2W7V4_9PROT|nr:cysteine--tRNA ligase [Hwanghaeella grinnelliae]RVU34926.1 cysteine--tRNA ligase [Hwanghaeella grinnelliae]